MADLPLSFLVHTVAVKTRSGSGAQGPVMAAPVSVQCYKEDIQQRVVTPAGTQMVTSATIYTTSEGCDGLDPLALFTEGSEVTWAAQRGGPTIVATVTPADDGGIGAWQHTVVTVI